VNTLPEAFADDNVKVRVTVIEDDLGRRHIAPAIRFGDEPAKPALREPALGEHTEEILGPLRRRRSQGAHVMAQS
jgi:crotonobetainyl-CoA:carnitine CoA-transferase CaiB-like acyl-CoA transferase